jgi:hypothetical protein
VWPKHYLNFWAKGYLNLTPHLSNLKALATYTQTKKNPKGFSLGEFQTRILDLESSRVAFGYHNLQLVQFWHKATKVINKKRVFKLPIADLVAILLLIATLNHPDKPLQASLAAGRARGNNNKNLFVKTRVQPHNTLERFTR